MDWQFLIGSGGLLGLGYLIFKFGRFTQKFDTFVISTTARFDSIDSRFNSVDIELKGIRKDLHSIDVRLSILEAETIMCNAMPDNNSRSAAAKEMWKKRKQKQLANIGAE